MKRHILSVRLPFLVAVLGLLTMGIFAKRGLLDLRRMLRNNIELDRQIAVAGLQCEELAKQIKALETSAFAQEQAVRQHLGYLRKDEIIVELP